MFITHAINFKVKGMADFISFNIIFNMYWIWTTPLGKREDEKLNIIILFSLEYCTPLAH